MYTGGRVKPPKEKCMKERAFTAEMLNKLTEAVKAVKGTGEYSKYNMELSFKSYQTGRYNFSTYSIPHITGTIKTYRGEMFIYTDDHCFGECRYRVSPEVAALLGLEVQA